MLALPTVRRNESMNQPFSLAASPYFRSPYIRTSWLYSLEGLSQDPEGGLDVVDPDGRRYLVTTVRDEASEDFIREQLGEHALPAYLGSDGGGNAVYDLPRSIMPMSRVFSAPPFDDEYMGRLQQQAQQALERLHALDASGFGVTLDNLALVHSAPAEYAHTPTEGYVVIIPPLTRALERQE